MRVGENTPVVLFFVEYEYDRETREWVWRVYRDDAGRGTRDRVGPNFGSFTAARCFAEVQS